MVGLAFCTICSGLRVWCSGFPAPSYHPIDLDGKNVHTFVRDTIQQKNFFI